MFEFYNKILNGKDNVRLHLLLENLKKNVANKDKYNDCELNFFGEI